MLANNFKSPADLGISDVDFRALFTVLGMLERGEIARTEFNMRVITHHCGTPACICGWANFISGGKAFPKTNDFPPRWEVLPQNLLDLFAVFNENNYENEAIQRARQTATPTQAAIAVRSYLTTGKANWAEALAAQ